MHLVVLDCFLAQLAFLSMLFTEFVQILIRKINQLQIVLKNDDITNMSFSGMQK